MNKKRKTEPAVFTGFPSRETPEEMKKETEKNRKEAQHAEKLAQKSRLTEQDVKRLSEKVKENTGKHAKRLFGSKKI